MRDPISHPSQRAAPEDHVHKRAYLDSVDTIAIKDDAVTSAKIAPDAIGTSELADNAVDTNAIANLAVTAAKIANDTITAGQIAASAVTASELATGAVTATKVNVPAVRAVWSANTNAVSGVDTAVAFGGTDEYDTDTMHNPAANNTRITFTTAGVYDVGGWYEMAGSAEVATNLHDIRIRKNGTTILAQHRILDHGSAIYMALSTEAKFAAADYVELIVWNGDNVNHNVVAGAFWAGYKTVG